MSVPPTPSIRVVKQFAYRGGIQRWSNRYHFNGGTPSDISHWTTLAQNVGAEEAKFLPATVTVVEYIGYAAGSELPVFTLADNSPGVFAPIGATEAPGDCAAVIRYSTTARSVKNHPIYLFNYYHAAFRSLSGTNDALEATQVTAMNTFASKWQQGFSDGVNTLVRAGPNGATAVGHLVMPDIRHRDFPD